MRLEVLSNWTGLSNKMVSRMAIEPARSATERWERIMERVSRNGMERIDADG
jgi:hypothetical protein